MFNKFLFRFKNPEESKFLVFDEMTDQHLKGIILNDFEYSILKIRNKEIYISFKILFLFIMLKNYD